MSLNEISSNLHKSCSNHLSVSHRFSMPFSYDTPKRHRLCGKLVLGKLPPKNIPDHCKGDIVTTRITSKRFIKIIDKGPHDFALRIEVLYASESGPFENTHMVNFKLPVEAIMSNFAHGDSENNLHIRMDLVQLGDTFEIEITGFFNEPYNIMLSNVHNGMTLLVDNFHDFDEKVWSLQPSVPNLNSNDWHSHSSLPGEEENSKPELDPRYVDGSINIEDLELPYLKPGRPIMRKRSDSNWEPYSSEDEGLGPNIPDLEDIIPFPDDTQDV